ncbi:hypothetical protein AYX14_05831 [Cryptococcus neoformans]|nr:hypothetical protein AYX14_05831 [Cryptococcus neoformans var. grubii]
MSARQQVPFRELSQKAKMPTSPPLKDIPIDRLSKRPFESEGGMSKNADNHRSSLLSPTASSSQSPVLRLSHRSPKVEDNGKKPSGSPPAARLPLLFRSPPTLPPLITRNPSRDPSPSSRTGPAPHQTVSHFEDRASPRKSKEHGHGCPPGGDYFPPGYRYPLGYPYAYSSSARQYHSSLPPIYTHPAEYYPVHVSTDRYYHAPPHVHYDLDDYYSPPRPFPAHVYSWGKDVYHRTPQPLRPRPHIHPYELPLSSEDDMRFYSADGKRYGSQLSHGLGSRSAGGSSDGRMGKGTSSTSPASATSTNAVAVISFKSPRKRTNDVQLAMLSEVFRRTQYPSTEERDELAKQLGMTSRSVQIWFQNRRRAVKVDQQSAIQCAEAEARAAKAALRGLPALPSLTDGVPGGSGSRKNSDAELEGSTEVDAVVKRERKSPDVGMED